MERRSSPELPSGWRHCLPPWRSVFVSVHQTFLMPPPCSDSTPTPSTPTSPLRIWPRTTVRRRNSLVICSYASAGQAGRCWRSCSPLLSRKMGLRGEDVGTVIQQQCCAINPQVVGHTSLMHTKCCNTCSLMRHNQHVKINLLTNL